MMSDTGMVVVDETYGHNNYTCAPESCMKYFERNKISGEWVQQKVNAAFSCGSGLNFKSNLRDLAIYKNMVALPGDYFYDLPDIPYTYKSPAVVLLYDLQTSVQAG